MNKLSIKLLIFLFFGAGIPIVMRAVNPTPAAAADKTSRWNSQGYLMKGLHRILRDDQRQNLLMYFAELKRHRAKVFKQLSPSFMYYIQYHDGTIKILTDTEILQHAIELLFGSVLEYKEEKRRRLRSAQESYKTASKEAAKRHGMYIHSNKEHYLKDLAFDNYEYKNAIFCTTDEDYLDAVLSCIPKVKKFWDTNGIPHIEEMRRCFEQNEKLSAINAPAAMSTVTATTDSNVSSPELVIDEDYDPELDEIIQGILNGNIIVCLEPDKVLTQKTFSGPYKAGHIKSDSIKALTQYPAYEKINNRNLDSIIGYIVGHRIVGHRDETIYIMNNSSNLTTKNLRSEDSVGVIIQALQDGSTVYMARTSPIWQFLSQPAAMSMRPSVATTAVDIQPRALPAIDENTPDNDDAMAGVESTVEQRQDQAGVPAVLRAQFNDREMDVIGILSGWKKSNKRKPDGAAADGEPFAKKIEK